MKFGSRNLGSVIRTVFFKLGCQISRTGGRRYPYLIERSFEDNAGNLKFWISCPLAERNYGGDWTSDPEYYGLKRLIEFNEIRNVVEIGAHHGFYSLALSQLLRGKGTVLSVEANPESALVAQANMTINSVPNVRMVCMAIGASLRNLCFDARMGKVLGDRRRASEADIIEVPVVPLDDLIEESVDLLKIDVEGFEAEVLRGATRVLQMRPCLALEVHAPFLSEFETSFKEIVEIANLHEYKGFIYDNRDPSLGNLRTWEGPESCPKDVVFHLFLSPRR